MDTEAARIHGRLTLTQRRWERAREMVAEHLTISPNSYVSWSGGKDSTVVAHLTHSMAPDVPILRLTHGVDYPETITYCDALAAEQGWPYVLGVAGDADTYLRRVDTDETDNSSYLSDATAALGYRPGGFLYGLRAEESRDRALHLASRRGAWTTRDGLRGCAPIWQWSTLDVWAYLTHHRIPVNPVYARLTELGAPETAHRVGFLVGGAGARTGRYYWLRRGWPDEWERMAVRLPWLRSVS